jgi:hypothetical protein
MYGATEDFAVDTARITPVQSKSTSDDKYPGFIYNNYLVQTQGQGNTQLLDTIELVRVDDTTHTDAILGYWDSKLQRGCSSTTGFCQGEYTVREKPHVSSTNLTLTFNDFVYRRNELCTDCIGSWDKLLNNWNPSNETLGSTGYGWDTNVYSFVPEGSSESEGTTNAV